MESDWKLVKTSKDQVPVNGETDEDDVGLRIRQRPKSVVGLLPGGVPQRELDLLPVNCQPENSGDILCQYLPISFIILPFACLLVQWVQLA